MDERFQKLWDELAKSIELADKQHNVDLRERLVATGVNLLATWTGYLRERHTAGR